MIGNTIYLKNEDTLDLVEIKGHSTFANDLIVKKFELNSDSLETDKFLTGLVNKSLNMMFCLNKETKKNHMFPLNFFSSKKFSDFKDIIFKSPITFIAKMNVETKEKATTMKTLSLIGIIQNNLKLLESDCIFQVELKKKLKNCILYDSFKCNLKVLFCFI